MLSRLFKTQLVRSSYTMGLVRPFGSAPQHQPVKDDQNDATSRFFDSVSSTLKGITHVNYIVEHDNNTSAEDKASFKRFLIYKYDPSVLSFHQPQITNRFE